MLIIKVMGGLGNQLQQYALYEKLRHIGREVKLDIGWYEEKGVHGTEREFELSRFDGLLYECCSKEERDKILKKSRTLSQRLWRKVKPDSGVIWEENVMYKPEIFQWEDKYLIGYWACEKYYADIMSYLREKLVFPLSQDVRNIQTVQQMERECSIAIHIRRGDYLDEYNAGMFGGICTEDYYKAAIQYVEKNVENPHFYFFSDDIDYVRQQFRMTNSTYVDWNTGNDSFHDMYLMSHCKHNICANSTFSIWGARLNGHKGAVKIRPLKHKNSQNVSEKEMKEYWNGWILIDERGRTV